MSFKDILDYLERIINRVANPIAIIAFLLGVLTLTVYHPLSREIAANTRADHTLSSNFYMVEMYDIIKQGEKFNGDTLDIKKADMFKLVGICEEDDFKSYLKNEAPTRMRLETEHICDLIAQESMRESITE